MTKLIYTKSVVRGRSLQGVYTREKYLDARISGLKRGEDVRSKGAYFQALTVKAYDSSSF